MKTNRSWFHLLIGYRERRYARRNTAVILSLRKTILVGFVGLLILLAACSANTTTTPQATATSPTSSAQQPTPTPSLPPKGTLLYQVNWTRGISGWQGSQGWTIDSGQLLTQSDASVAITIPYTPTTPDYAIEMRIQVVRLLHQNGGHFYINSPNTPDKDGYQAGIYDLKGTQPRPNGDHPTAFVMIQPQATTNIYDFHVMDYEPHSDWHTYRIEIQDNQASFFIDGSPAGTASSSQTDTLSEGPLTLNSAEIVMRVSSFSITAL